MKPAVTRGVAMLRDLDDTTLLGSPTSVIPAVPLIAGVPTVAKRTGALARFRTNLGSLWPDVEPLSRVADHVPDALLMKARFWRLGVQVNPAHANELVLELEALAAGWRHFDDDRRRVLTGALSYLIAMPTPDATDLRRADDVVGAAVRAVIGRAAA